MATWNEAIRDLINRDQAVKSQIEAVKRSQSKPLFMGEQERKLAILEKNNELLTESNAKLVLSNENLLERIGWLEGQLNLFLTQTEGSA